MPAGRPSIYGDEILEKAQKYLDDITLTRIVETKVSGKFGKTTTEKEVPNSIPSIAGLALTLKVNRDTIYDWEKKFKEFSDILSQLRLKQEHFLIHHGLTDGYNSNFAKFIATNVTKFRDKQEAASTEKKDTSVIVNLYNQTSKPEDGS